MSYSFRSRNTFFPCSTKSRTTDIPAAVYNSNQPCTGDSAAEPLDKHTSLIRGVEIESDDDGGFVHKIRTAFSPRSMHASNPVCTGVSAFKGGGIVFRKADKQAARGLGIVQKGVKIRGALHRTDANSRLFFRPPGWRPAAHIRWRRAETARNGPGSRRYGARHRHFPRMADEPEAGDVRAAVDVDGDMPRQAVRFNVSIEPIAAFTCPARRFPF